MMLITGRVILERCASTAVRNVADMTRRGRFAAPQPTQEEE